MMMDFLLDLFDALHALSEYIDTFVFNASMPRSLKIGLLAPSTAATPSHPISLVYPQILSNPISPVPAYFPTIPASLASP